MRDLLRKLETPLTASEQGPPEQDTLYDLVFVMNTSAKGWILERICKEIERHTDLHCGWVYSDFNDTFPNGLPAARGYFFAHYLIATFALAQFAHVRRARSFVYFTHPDFTRGGVGPAELLAAFALCDQVFCMNSGHASFLKTLGVAPEKLSVAVGGVNPETFQRPPQDRTTVGFVGGYYERKNPDKIIAVIQDNPDRNFVLLEGDHQEVSNSGIWWENAPQYDTLAALPNLEIIQAKYADYPDHYARMSCYVSLAKLEGGPISILEAFAAGVYPVISDTGFARDVITAPEHGKIIANLDDLAEIKAHITYADTCDRAVLKDQANRYSWKAMAEGMLPHLSGQGRSTGLEPGIYPIGEGQLSSQWLTFGWHRVEREGVWSQPPRFTLQLPALSEAVEAISLTVHTQVPAGIAELHLSCNGRVEEVHNLSNKRQAIRINISAEHRRGLEIVADSDYFFVPQDQIANSSDDRKLAVYLSEIELHGST